MECDFCSDPNPRWSYPCRDFIVTGPASELIMNESLGPWAACDTCYEMIQLGFHRTLAARSAQKLFKKVPELKQHSHAIYGTLRDLHEQFFAHRVGMPELIEPESIN